MNVVEKVAEDIADIPGDPSTLEIARIAIEAYQREIWSPAFGTTNRGGFRFMPELRRNRANNIASHIMHIISKYLCDHGDAHGHRHAARDLMEALYESGAEIVTDADRAMAGLPIRGPYGLTAEELKILEARHTEMMLRPITHFVEQKLR